LSNFLTYELQLIMLHLLFYAVSMLIKTKSSFSPNYMIYLSFLNLSKLLSFYMANAYFVSA
jgi:hypothetical protein